MHNRSYWRKKHRAFLCCHTGCRAEEEVPRGCRNCVLDIQLSNCSLLTFSGQIPGVPLIYAIRNALFLERPSAVQQEFAKAAEEERSHMTEVELKMLKSKKKRVANGEARDSSETDEDHILEIQDPRTNVNRNRVDKLDKPQFKRNKAKGPNPLSCKKKKKQGKTDTASEKMRSQIRSQEGDGDNSARNRSRKRKRSKKSKSSTEQIVH